MNVASTTLDFVTKFFEGVEAEVQSDIPAATRSPLYAYYRPAGLLSPWRRPYFFQHYAAPVARALEFLVLNQAARRPPVILDLGCGLGSQSIIFAAHGARVVAFDLDEPALKVLIARRDWYEKKLGRKLDITPVCGNALTHDLAVFAPLDGVFSLFAFNMMQPSHVLLARLARYLAPSGRLAIQDGNRSSWYNALPSRRRPILSPLEFRAALEELGFGVEFHEATGCVPPAVCQILPDSGRAAVHSALKRTWRIGVSQQILAARSGT